MERLRFNRCLGGLGTDLWAHVNKRLTDSGVDKQTPSSGNDVLGFLYTKNTEQITVTMQYALTANNSLPPLHYLIDCPAHPTCRQRLKDQLNPQQHSWTDNDIAALLIRKATIIPDIIFPLLKKDPLNSVII